MQNRGPQWLALAAAALTIVAASSTANAQTYPSKPVRVVVPFVPGGSTDVVARLIAQHLTNNLGQQFYIENHGGAGGNIGMDSRPPRRRMATPCSSSATASSSIPTSTRKSRTIRSRTSRR